MVNGPRKCPHPLAVDGFNEACAKVGIQHYAIWSATYLETLLYADYHDILFGFFGINMTGERNDTISAIRRNLALKKRMHKELLKTNISETDKNAIRYNGAHWLKFKYSEVLIRSIYDKNYPDISNDFSGYYKTEIYNWYHNGIEVRAFPYVVDAKVRQLKRSRDINLENPDNYEIIRCRLEVFGCIPFENIIDYDMDGDEYYIIPHLFCDYPCGSNPYEAIRYRTKEGFVVNNENIKEIL